MKIFEALDKHGKDGYYSFHMPGHKNTNIGYCPKIEDDVTELYGMDDLHDPKGIILESMQKAMAIYNTAFSYYSTSGSTAANMAAIDSVTNINDTIIVMGDYHVSVKNIATIKRLKIIFIPSQPINNCCSIKGPVDFSALEDTIKNNNASAVFVTSPTYEGIISDISSISKISHKYNIPLIVDEAHGAHLALSDLFPKSAIESGADIVINSLHKTLPAITGTSIIHVPHKSIVSPQKLKESLLRLLSTSPSYLMLASIDKCVDLIAKDGAKLFATLNENIEYLYSRLSNLHNIVLLKIDINQGIQDKSRLVFVCKNKKITGHKIAEILYNKYKIEIEKSCDDYIIAITSIADTIDGFNRLINAMLEIDADLT